MNKTLFCLGATSPQVTIREPPEPLEIGTGTSTSSEFPMYLYYDYGVFIYLYKQSELGSSKTISDIAFDMVNTSSSTYTANNQTLKFAHSSATVIPDNVKTDLTNLPYTDLTTVKNNFTWSVNSVEEWKNINLDTNFNYNGTDSLLVIWENRDGSYISGTSSNPRCKVTSDGTFNVFQKYVDNTFPTSSYGTKDSTGKPNLRLQFA
jgi:hypothetical protein